MKVLCIDVGNTSVHYGIVEGQMVHMSDHFPTEHFRAGASKPFSEKLKDYISEVVGVSFCSVVPDINENLVCSIPPGSLPVFNLTHLNCHGLKLNYPKPQEIGQDRLANSIAAQEYYGAPAIILDMGTAATLDIVSSFGYEGGIIAPGLAVMTDYLHEQTALLPKLKAEELVKIEGSIGKSTVHAMQLGVSIGFSGMLDALLSRIFTELQERENIEPIVLSTGGSIANLAKEWSQKSLFVEDLTLVGLAVAFCREIR